MQADDLDDAVSEADNFIETERELGDYHEIISDECGVYDNGIRETLLELQNSYQPKKKAGEYFARAMKLKDEGDLDNAGFLFYLAGSLWMGKPALEIPYYNISDSDFSVPDVASGLFYITAIVHY
ncbi:MAG: hypothetical protein LBT24_05260 [Tannerella sp.]|nr:hypothetical protein [Tannerella sp.]